MSFVDQLRSQLTIVVNLAVKSDPKRGVFIRKRLMATGKIDNAQPSIPQPEFLINVKSLVVGAAMRHGVGRASQSLRVHGRAASKVKYSTDSAHSLISVNLSGFSGGKKRARFASNTRQQQMKQGHRFRSRIRAAVA